ncbi:hypothetical protein MKX01_031357, partial [Papaver californicum]
MTKILSKTLTKLFFSSHTKIFHHGSLNQLTDFTKFEKYVYAILFMHKLGLNKYGPTISGLNTSSG